MIRKPICLEFDISVPSYDFAVEFDTAVGLEMSTAISPETAPIPIPEYTGDYEVTPHFSEQYLLTSGKRMVNDVTIHEIPVVRTTNPYGGQTIVIG